MGKVISVRINKSLEERINRYSKEKKEEQSEVIRVLIKNGRLYLAIKGLIYNNVSSNIQILMNPI
ncbi:MAG: hypothetical protein BAJALOKI2v1_240023 [Promethearchaeota archaeon]|nr:MAG: hypothetical protein BAJALOKI2v1_240023 [Candidatus Lokiarchaeota archaeon]